MNVWLMCRVSIAGTVSALSSRASSVPRRQASPIPARDLALCSLLPLAKLGRFTELRRLLQLGRAKLLPLMVIGAVGAGLHGLSLWSGLQLAPSWTAVAAAAEGENAAPSENATQAESSTGGQAAAEVADPQPHWIWGAGGKTDTDRPETCHFERKFEISAEQLAAGAELRITCDNRYVVRLNGRLVGIGHNWNSWDRYDVGALLQAGENVLHVVARNDEGVAGLLVDLRGGGEPGMAWRVVSDAQWQGAVQQDGTWDPAVEQSHRWQPAVDLGPHPTTAPWGDGAALSNEVRRPRNRESTGGLGQLRLNDGDRVVWLGDTLIERAQYYDYWETRLTTQFPGKKISFRNLGWSGDTVWGHARARFGTVADGFEHLEVQVHSLEPTVIIVGYGANESAQGVAGREAFQAGLDQLLSTLSATGARIVLCSPIQQENLGPPYPEATPRNINRHLYREAMRQLAQRDGLDFIDLFQPSEDIDSPGHRLTYNGIHLHSYGYYRLGSQLAEQLGLPRSPWSVDVDVAQQVYDARGVKVQGMTWGDARWELKLNSRTLPYLFDREPGESLPAELEDDGYQAFRVRGLPAGRYRLEIEGSEVAVASAEDWASGIRLTAGPDFAQSRELRTKIRRKNELFFHRWRPQNETYLFLFRKHEQGNNAVEIPQFDPLILELEEQIQQLSVPREQLWVLQRVAE